METKLAEWQDELCSYLSNGNGEHCPLREHCRTEQECNWCLDEHGKELSRLVDSGELGVSITDFLPPQIGTLGRPIQLVERQADEYLKMGKVQGPPTPAVLVALFDPERTVEVHKIPLKAYHGAIWCLADRWVIQLSSQDTPARRRCTLFHEAFHILAHRSCGKRTPVFRRVGVEGGYFNELLADYFAVCILMPREWVKEKWAEVHDVNAMARIFNTPKVVMWFRLRQMGLV